MSREALLNGIKILLYISLILVLTFVNAAGLRWMEVESAAVSMMDVFAEKFEKGIENRQIEIESRKTEKTDKVEKIAYLTFDDGPSDNTDRILDVLKEKGVKATFFVVGKTGTKTEERYRRIVEEGHTLGIHSYTHKYEEIYGSLEGFKEDVLKLREYLYEVTGEQVWAYRFPGGSSNRVAKVDIGECISFLKEEGMVHFDWNASSEDAVAVGVSGSTLNSNVLKDALRFQYPMILMHDLHECNNTVEGLPALIDRLQEEGYQIQAVTRETEPVQHVKEGSKTEK